MSKPTQLDLLPREKPDELLAFLKGRLPGADLLLVSEVAGAFNVSILTVYAWIDEGLVQAVNIGAAHRPYWKVYRKSVLKLMEERVYDGQH